jgi:hypothetical protein
VLRRFGPETSPTELGLNPKVFLAHGEAEPSSGACSLDISGPGAQSGATALTVLDRGECSMALQRVLGQPVEDPRSASRHSLGRAPPPSDHSSACRAHVLGLRSSTKGGLRCRIT